MTSNSPGVLVFYRSLSRERRMRGRRLMIVAIIVAASSSTMLLETRSASHADGRSPAAFAYFPY